MSLQEYPRYTLHLPRTDIFNQPLHKMDDHDRAYLSYEKARAIGLSYSEFVLWKRFPFHCGVSLLYHRHDNRRYCVFDPEVLADAQRSHRPTRRCSNHAARHPVQSMRRDHCTLHQAAARTFWLDRRPLAVSKTVSRMISALLDALFAILTAMYSVANSCSLSLVTASTFTAWRQQLRCSLQTSLIYTLPHLPQQSMSIPTFIFLFSCS